jgi:thiol-disulfide isomerase/thioredoxin
LALTALGVITASIVAAVTFSSPAPTIPLLNLPVPKFSLQGLKPGQAGVSSAELRSGGATVVNFWGSWCPPCVEEMPALQEVHHLLGGQVRFV